MAMYDWEKFSARVLISAIDMAPVERLRICAERGTVLVCGNDNCGQVVKYSSTGSETYSYSNSILLAKPIYSILIDAVMTGRRDVIMEHLNNAKKIFGLMDQTRQSLSI
jgi:hypothetical protein